MALFFRLLDAGDKEASLGTALRELHTFDVDPNRFSKIPGSPFAYWVSESIREL